MPEPKSQIISTYKFKTNKQRKMTKVKSYILSCLNVIAIWRVFLPTIFVCCDHFKFDINMP
uniref:HL01468p n=1 Tax=Drosophila melanogaster TaxID=7227 RepID=Q8MSY8_DROME|nr:HL01468p [Drosophila melanogaster]